MQNANCKMQNAKCKMQLCKIQNANLIAPNPAKVSKNFWGRPVHVQCTCAKCKYAKYTLGWVVIASPLAKVAISPQLGDYHCNQPRSDHCWFAK